LGQLSTGLDYLLTFSKPVAMELRAIPLMDMERVSLEATFHTFGVALIFPQY